METAFAFTAGNNLLTKYSFAYIAKYFVDALFT